MEKTNSEIAKNYLFFFFFFCNHFTPGKAIMPLGRRKLQGVAENEKTLVRRDEEKRTIKEPI